MAELNFSSPRLVGAEDQATGAVRAAFCALVVVVVTLRMWHRGSITAAGDAGLRNAPCPPSDKAPTLSAISRKRLKSQARE